ncbi:MAG: helix-turn-helix transcriptional regulator [Paludibacter sp.]|nr:helix-turn-helix transcriptional regulator [Paludibacter sp.]
METTIKKEVHPILSNIRKIMNERNLTQAAIAEYAETSPSQLSKIFKGEVQLSLWQLSNIATKLNMSIVDIITYPDKYYKMGKGSEDLKATLTVELKKDVKEQVLKLIFGNENIKILNE